MVSYSFVLFAIYHRSQLFYVKTSSDPPRCQGRDAGPCIELLRERAELKHALSGWTDRNIGSRDEEKEAFQKERVSLLKGAMTRESR